MGWSLKKSLLMAFPNLRLLLDAWKMKIGIMDNFTCVSVPRKAN